MTNQKTKIAFFVIGITASLCIPAFGAGGHLVDNESKINIGFSAGPNLTHIVRDFDNSLWIISPGYSTEAKPALSYAAGLFFQCNFSKSSSLRTEILYNRKGLHDQYVLFTQNTAGVFHIYFERLIVPLYYRARLGKLFIDAGIFAGYAIRNVTVLRNHQQPSLPDPHKATFDVEKPLFKGLSAGIGYNFLDNRSYSLSVELRDEYELTNKRSFNTNFLSLNTVNLLAGIAIKL